MAIYKIFPQQDNFIFTQVVTANAGKDEILEIGGYEIRNIGQASRALLQFKSTEISDIVDNKIGSNNYSASLEMKIASAYETPFTHSVESFPLAESWEPGLGKFADDILTGSADKSGCSWRYRKANQVDSWTLESFTALTTGSYSSTYPGGGVWYTGSSGINLKATQSFEPNGDLDIDINVTEAVKLHKAGTIANNGFVVKFTDDLEFLPSQSIIHKYYSADTNTIYPPTLTFKWDDSSYDTGSLSVLNNSEAIIQVTNNAGEYADEGKARFRLLARPKNPTRTFVTASLYKTNYALPSGSYYALQDEFTEELEIPFNTTFTKISCDSTGPFLDLYLDGLQPERHYRLLIKQGELYEPRF